MTAISLFSRPLARRAARMLVWAMVALLPLQAIAAATLAAGGPLHAHRSAATTATAATAATMGVLDDVRRSPRLATAAQRAPAAHVHGLVAARHHHANDASVVAVDDPWSAADVDGLGAALAGQLALGAALQEWRADALDDVRASTAPWWPRTHVPPPRERPPRRGA